MEMKAKNYWEEEREGRKRRKRKDRRRMRTMEILFTEIENSVIVKYGRNDIRIVRVC